MIGRWISLIPEGFGAAEPSINLDIGRQDEGGWAYGAWEIGSLRNPDLVERGLGNQGLGKIGSGIGPTGTISRANGILVDVEYTGTGCGKLVTNGIGKDRAKAKG